MDERETRLTESILIFTVEGDDAIQLKIGGVKIGAWGPSCKQAIALLKLEAELRTLRSVEPPREMVAMAERIAKNANECCGRSDGYEEQVRDLAPAELTALRSQTLDEAARVAEDPNISVRDTAAAIRALTGRDAAPGW